MNSVDWTNIVKYSILSRQEPGPCNGPEGTGSRGPDCTSGRGGEITIVLDIHTKSGENMVIKRAEGPAEILLCWEAMKALRPHLGREEFVATVTEMISEGYELAYIEEDGVAAAAVGFRYLQFLHNGKHIYIDDLSTLPRFRRKGYGAMLLDYVFRYASERGLKVVTLDSGPARHDAHRLYLNSGFTISSLHFSKTLP